MVVMMIVMLLLMMLVTRHVHDVGDGGDHCHHLCDDGCLNSLLW